VIGENKAVEDLTVVVTGASSGVGLAAAQEFARRGARVVVVGRDPDRLASAVSAVQEAAGSAPDQFRADFARLDEVRALAAHLLDRYEKIDVLANNAGGLVSKFTSTVDGYESTIQGNHLAPFLLTNLLRDRLRGGRVVNTASDAHRSGVPDPDNLTGNGGRYSAFGTYGASKAANILFAAEAGRRWPDILSTSYHPGVVRSRFGSDSFAVSMFYKITPFLVTPAGGADTMVWLATTDAAEVTQGGYYIKRQLRQPAPAAADPELAARLWEASAKAVGL
jgi:NAD(P)-dependent dehydrogenase (short-subunit alcohol dehydrogenase family)